MADMRVEDLTDVDVTQLGEGSALVYDATRRIWRASTQAVAATKSDIDAAIVAALATLRVQ